MVDIRKKQRDRGERLEQAEVLEREAQSATANAEATTKVGSTVEVLDRKVVQLEQRMVTSLSAERDLDEAMKPYASAGEVDEAALEKRLKSLQTSLDDRNTQVRALEQQLAKNNGILETKKQELVSQERERREASDALGQPFLEVLEQTEKELEVLGAEREQKQQELNLLERDLTSEVEQARSNLEQASAALRGAELRTKEVTTEAEDAQRDLDKLTGEVSTRQELADREDLQAALAALAELESRLDTLPKPETDVTDAQRPEAGGLVREAKDQRDELQSELQKAEGALQQVGGHYIQEKLEQADEAVQAIDRRERELDLDYGAWQLLRDTLQEAEAEDAVHLGKALIEPITTRMAKLTDGRYGNLVIGPKLQTESIALVGTQRDITSLSVGTQGQLATVLRLTIADAVGSTVVLDDQLVQSDASRMDWLRAFMMECASRFQILVFTCRPQQYESRETGEQPAFKSIDLAECLMRSP